MKTTLGLTTTILVVGAALGWSDRQRLRDLQNDERRVEVRARAYGISLENGNPAAGRALKRRSRDGRRQEPRREAMEAVSLLKEVQEIQGSDSGSQKRSADLMRILMDLSPRHLRVLFNELEDAEGLDDRTKQGLAAFAIALLAERNPQAALALLVEPTGVFGGPRMGDAVRVALSRWANDDPRAAAGWVRTNSKSPPDAITAHAQRGLIEGAAAQDPRLAFHLLEELGLKESSDLVGLIVSEARTPEARTATLEALRGHLSGLPEGEGRQKITRRALWRLARSFAGEEFEAAASWLAGAALEPQEITAIASGLKYDITRQDTGRWLEWMARELPATLVRDSAKVLMSRWTQEDVEAAGVWLAQAPDDAAKATAVSAYAGAVARHAPEIAEQWALTLPPGSDDRKKTLETIYKKWPEDDETGKRAFAGRYDFR